MCCELDKLGLTSGPQRKGSRVSLYFIFHEVNGADDTRGVIYNCPEFGHCGGWKKQGFSFFNSKTYF